MFRLLIAIFLSLVAPAGFAQTAGSIDAETLRDIETRADEAMRQYLANMPAFDTELSRLDCESVHDYLQAPSETPKDSSALVAVAAIYEVGRCVPADLAKAAMLYQQAIELGEGLYAAIRLAGLYARGLWVEQRLDRASDLFRLGALSLSVLEPRERDMIIGKLLGQEPIPPLLAHHIAWVDFVQGGDPRRLYEGAMTLKALRDQPVFFGDHIIYAQLIRQWLTFAALKDVPEAGFEAGMYILASEGVNADVFRAASLIGLSAHSGYLPAVLTLAEWNITGKILKPDPAIAYLWLAVARKLGADVDIPMRNVSRDLSKAERLFMDRRAKKNGSPSMFGRVRD